MLVYVCEGGRGVHNLYILIILKYYSIIDSYLRYTIQY